MKQTVIAFLLFINVLSVSAQSWYPEDIKWINGLEFAENVDRWKNNHQLSEDDNFFISRVRPRLRFRNSSTQIDPQLQEGVDDKRLCAWLPINTCYSGDNKNALPTGEFDSECFTMWSYVDHWGNWSAPLGAVPGNFADVAHKNGVAVSSLAPIPFGTITTSWSAALDKIAELDGADVARMLVYYGMDGLGYNSEFQGYSAAKLESLRTMHQSLLVNLKEGYNKVVPGYNLQENIWYDGTSDSGKILFDYGLDVHNIKNWGPLGQERSSLFLNYNWNTPALLVKSNDNAFLIGEDRSPLFLYCGINMQGGEPDADERNWELLKDFPLSIGLWGAHSENMFWVNRFDNGQSPLSRQQTYQQRIEQWFSGSNHNPAKLPDFSTNTICYTGDKNFHGMATYMSARSSLSWDLSEAPFISNFNVGNGLFFNWKGQRMNDNEWYNIGIQDYMPTWRWWQSSEFMGRDSNLATSGLLPSFYWEDAYLGGSCLKIAGTAEKSCLHLFKTSFQLKSSDKLTVRYKNKGNRGEISLVGSVEGAESLKSFAIPMSDSAEKDANGWSTVEVSAGDLELTGKTLAMIALEFQNCQDVNLLLGEISLKREEAPMPVTPQIGKVKILRNTHKGIDAKILFDVPNSKLPGEVCYNDEVGASMFKIYSQEEGCEPELRGATTSWAAMSYSTPFDGDDKGEGKIRFGVSAVSMDMESESPISWSEWLISGEHTFINDIEIDKSIITPGENFTLSAVDSKRKFEWEITEANNPENIVASSNEACNKWSCDGISKLGIYDLYYTIPNTTETIVLKGFISITNPARGRLPEILELTANNETVEISILPDQDVKFEYRGKYADGYRSRGLVLDEKPFGIRVGEVLDAEDQSFSIAGWLKIDEFPGTVNWIDIVERDGLWPRNNWGWLWTSINPDGTINNYSQDFSPMDKGVSTKVVKYYFGDSRDTFFNKGKWNHFALVFERNALKSRTLLYINGELVESDWEYVSCSDYNTSERRLATGGTEDFIPASKPLKLNNYILIGGTRRSGRGDSGSGLTGVLDDLEIWNSAMTPQQVLNSMDGMTDDYHPDGLAAYFDFESDADEENMFSSMGSKPDAKGGYLQLLPSDAGEGQSTYNFISPEFTPGTPFIEGGDYKIVTLPEWKISGAEVAHIEGDGEYGSAVARFPYSSEPYTAELTLKNQLGEDKKTFSYIKIINPDRVEEISSDEVKTYVVDKNLVVETSQSGNYEISVCGIDGQIISSLRTELKAGNKISVSLPASGIYMMRIIYENKTLNPLKFIVK